MEGLGASVGASLTPRALHTACHRGASRACSLGLPTRPHQLQRLCELSPWNRRENFRSGVGEVGCGQQTVDKWPCLEDACGGWGVYLQVGTSQHPLFAGWRGPKPVSSRWAFMA